MIETKIKKVILWGHKLHSHTHSYIHFGFKKAFEYLNYETLWLDNTDNIDNIDFTNSLFITEGQVDSKIPLLNNCYYVLHNCNLEKYYNNISFNNIILLKVYTNFKPTNSIKIENEELSFYDDNWLITTWATDLLPNEIQENINLLNDNKIINDEPKTLQFIGMPLYPWDLVDNFCKNNNILYRQCGGFSNNNVSSEENMKLIQSSYLSPAIQSKWQVDNHYIPCRIFKNISYGKIGITNNKGVYELFNRQVLFDTNIDELLKKSIIFENKTNDYKNHQITLLMEYVKNYHTYLNRIKCIFFLLNKLNL